MSSDHLENTLKDVLYIPRLSANLISVKYLAAKLNVQTIVDATCYTLIKKDTNKVLATATSKGNGLYLLNTVQSSAFLSTIKTESINTWHNRLAHLSYARLEKLK